MDTKRIKFAYVAYHFPPIAGGLSLRSAQFCRYLPDFDVNLEVFTTALGTKSIYLDPTSLEPYSDLLKIHRCSDFYSSKWVSALGDYSDVLRYLVRGFSFPDIHRGWAKRVFLDIEKSHALSPFDGIFTTSFPWSSHLVGLWAKRHLNLSWVSDFRDPWSNNYDLKAKLTLPYHRWLEQAVYTQSDHVIFNTESHRLSTLNDFDLPPFKTSFIPNGFDPEILNIIKPANYPDTKLRIGYLGGLRGDPFEGPFYRALASLRELNRELFESIEVNFIGVSEVKGSLAEKLSLKSNFVFHGFLPELLAA
ncbi:MAG: glycosyltransferase, partial [Bdellovibrionales bacterium]|nr:glycosyltransferase [Bdellovibrionales bacterium]